MDTVNEITSKPSTTQKNGLFEIENTNETTTNQNDDSSSLIENNPIASSQVPTISNGDSLKNNNEITKSPNEDSSSLPENNSTTPSQSGDATLGQVPIISDGDLFENTNAITSNQNDDSSWLIENNPTTSSQSDDVTKSQVPTVFNGDAFGYINEITKNQNHDSSWLIESDPKTSFQSDDTTKSQVPTISNSNPFVLPPTAEEILANNSSNHQIPSSDNKFSFDMFSNEPYSPLQAIMKKREEEIAAKDVEEKKKIEILRQEAKSDLENWYKDRQRQMEQKRQTMKKAENDLHTKALEKSSKEACDWSKVIRLLDFTDGTQLTKSKRDLTRMKTCIFNAKRISDKKNINK